MLKVGILGFEPAIQTSLESLLAREAGLRVIVFPRHWSPQQGLCPCEDPDVLLVSPPGPDWVSELHHRYPRARMVAQVEWNRREQFRSSPISDFFERCQGYDGLLSSIRQATPQAGGN